MESYKKVIIIGAGIFGISTAIALAKRHPNVLIQVIDRYEPPVLDSTSVDTTRCIRVDYKDETYYKLAFESMKKIKSDPVISKFFHQCGMSFIYDGNHDKWENIYITGRASAEKANKSLENMMVYYDTPFEVFKRIHGADTPTQDEEALGRQTWWNKGYTNLSNGFIDAEKSMKAYYERAKTYPNIKFIFQEVEKLEYYERTKKFKNVLLKNGESILADLVVVAAGAWSAKLINLEDICKISAIEVAWYKLIPEEQEQWKNMSITTNLSTGINIFPPYNGEIKVLRRSAGYKNTITVRNPDPLSDGEMSISYPRTIINNPTDWIPKEAEVALRTNLKEIMPSLYKRPFDRTKLCWLTQTPTANFLIDYHPHCENVLLATGGSAHAWKFVPIIGDKVVDFMEGKLAQELIDMWSWKEKVCVNNDNGSAPRMSGEPQELKDVVRNADTLDDFENLCI